MSSDSELPPAVISSETWSPRPHQSARESFRGPRTGRIHADSSPRRRGASNSASVSNLDLGCGFGGVTVALARLFPHEVTVGVEIRRKVVQYVHERLGRRSALGNAAVVASNGMKFLPHFFPAASLARVFRALSRPAFQAKELSPPHCLPPARSPSTRTCCASAACSTASPTSRTWPTGCSPISTHFPALSAASPTRPSSPLIPASNLIHVHQRGGAKGRQGRRLTSTPPSIVASRAMPRALTARPPTLPPTPTPPKPPQSVPLIDSRAVHSNVQMSHRHQKNVFVTNKIAATPGELRDDDSFSFSFVVTVSVTVVVVVVVVVSPSL
jgi:hypothetical protein